MAQKLGILDIVALAKAGYKASEVKELMSMDIQETAPVDGGADNPADKDKQPPAENSAKETEKDKEGDPEEENNIDYKSLYEEKCKELEKAQNANVHQNQPEIKPQKTLDDIVRSFM